MYELIFAVTRSLTWSTKITQFLIKNVLKLCVIKSKYVMWKYKNILNIFKHIKRKNKYIVKLLKLK